MISKEVREGVLKILSRPNDNVLVRKNGTTQEIVLNRPTRSNAMAMDMYIKVTAGIRAANRDPTIKFILIRGEGKSFSSGNDLSLFTSTDFLEFDTKEFITFISLEVLEDYGRALVESEKPIIAIVQGKSIGVGFTQLPHCDRVFAIEGATFKAPLVKLAQGPEMCSSYTFPKLFGKKEADEILIGAKEVTAEYVAKYGLVEVCKDPADVAIRLKAFTDMVQGVDWPSYLNARRLMKAADRQTMLKINHLQCLNLIERWLNPEMTKFMAKYMQSTKSMQSTKAKL